MTHGAAVGRSVVLEVGADTASRTLRVSLVEIVPIFVVDVDELPQLAVTRGEAVVRGLSEKTSAGHSSMF